MFTAYGVRGVSLDDHHSLFWPLGLSIPVHSQDGSRSVRWHSSWRGKGRPGLALQLNQWVCTASFVEPKLSSKYKGELALMRA